MSNFLKSEVIKNQPLNHKFHRLQFKASSPGFTFEAGQFVLLKVSDTVFRCYSVASTNHSLPSWDILVDITPGGPGSTYLKNLKTGDVIETSQPRGVFTLKKDTASHVVLGATGCGIASIKPMIETLLLSEDKKQIHLLWGLRHIKDMIFLEDLQKLQEQYPHFSFHIVLSQPEEKWEGKTGHITTHLVEHIQDLPKETTSVYLCGNSGMIMDLNENLKKQGFIAERIYFERYY